VNSKTVLTIIVLGLLGGFAVVIAGLMGVTKLADQPLVRIRIEIAEQHKVKEVSLKIVPPTGSLRDIEVGYETNVMQLANDLLEQEMEAVAKSAVDKIRAMEFSESLRLKREGKTQPEWGPLGKVRIRRTWRSDKGCFKRSATSTHEWTPPPAPLPGRRS
jgi:hypothetical protein